MRGGRKEAHAGLQVPKSLLIGNLYRHTLLITVTITLDGIYSRIVLSRRTKTAEIDSWQPKGLGLFIRLYTEGIALSICII